MKIGMLFPDYGSQYVGMGKELYDSSRLIQEYFEEASNCLNTNFVRLCFASSEGELGSINNAYPAIFLLSSALVGLLKEKNIHPYKVAGYGIGEFSALNATHGLSLPDGLYFLSKYAQFYIDVLANLTVRALMVRNVSVRKVNTICQQARAENELVTIAAYNTSTDCWIVGITSAVDRAEDLIIQAGGVVDEASIEAGLHSSLMQPVIDQLKIYLEKIDFHDLTVPLIASIDGKEIIKGRMARDRVMKQLQSPIRWDKVMSAIHDWDLVIELGPGATLLPLVRKVYPDKFCISINKPEDIDILEEQSALVRHKYEVPTEPLT